MINIFLDKEKIADLKQGTQSFLLDYKNFDIEKSISLSLPNSKKFYAWEHRFPPYFESFLPEGYLYEIFKNILTKKYGYVDEYLIFSLLSPNLLGRISFQTEFQSLDFEPFDIEEILNNDTPDTFSTLLNTFLDKNAISGVQPKTVAIVKDKESLHTKEYIIKTWGEEFPYLAENEYFCLGAVKKAGVKTVKTQLSKNNKFLLVENFIFNRDEVFGFEEILSLMDKNKIHKYQGSYEQVSKIILQFCTDKSEALEQFYKTLVMSYLLKNGDAHLKNFGLLFSKDFSTIEFSPAYDIVTTTAYIFKDKPALTLDGQKVWPSKKTLLNFAKTYCLLSKQEALRAYDECIDALEKSMVELKNYIALNPHFEKVGTRMYESWSLSLSGETLKEISDDTIRNWK
ncbi:MAG: type II toxin-antitoxin system HipA family toxin [Sulfurimonas sp.]|nr:type II toxin-antitoxin system HipA family toxin [Sulfurimonas sp.]